MDVELVGSLHWLGLSFNAVTAINLLLAIGIAVDYSAFIAYSFMDSHGSRDARAKKALARLGVAVFNGGFTVFLAIVCCAGAQSYIFRTFFKVRGEEGVRRGWQSTRVYRRLDRCISGCFACLSGGAKLVALLNSIV